MAFFKYASDAELIQDKLPNVKSSDDQETIARLNEAVSAFVDTYTERSSGIFLPASATATARYIRGEGRNYLRLPVHVFGAISVATIDSNLYYESEKNGWLYAIDATQSTPNSEPPQIETVDFWQRGFQYIVTARWGYEETPAEIIEAVKQIVAKWFNVAQGVFGEVTPQGFIIERDAPKSALMLLDKFKRREYEIV